MPRKAPITRTTGRSMLDLAMPGPRQNRSGVMQRIVKNVLLDLAMGKLEEKSMGPTAAEKSAAETSGAAVREAVARGKEANALQVQLEEVRTDHAELREAVGTLAGEVGELKGRVLEWRGLALAMKASHQGRAGRPCSCTSCEEVAGLLGRERAEVAVE